MVGPSEHTIRQQLMDAGVWQAGHVILNSGRHSDVKLDMERLLLPRNTMRLRAVMHHLATLVAHQEYDAIVPVPEGALRLAEAVEIPDYLPRILPSDKTGKREFAFRHPAARAIIRRAGRLAIFDDVVTTGHTPLAMAQTVRDINPEVAVDLLAIWRRDTLDPAVAETFVEQFFIVEETVPSWPASECQEHDSL